MGHEESRLARRLIRKRCDIAPHGLGHAPSGRTPVRMRPALLAAELLEVSHPLVD
jgi:hypothetical protein